MDQPKYAESHCGAFVRTSVGQIEVYLLHCVVTVYGASSNLRSAEGKFSVEYQLAAPPADNIECSFIRTESGPGLLEFHVC